MISLTPAASKERDLSWFDYSTAATFRLMARPFSSMSRDTGVKGTHTVYLRKTDGSDAVRLGEGKPLTLSPDGKWALVLQQASPPQLILLPTGPGEQRLLPRGPIQEYTHWAAGLPMEAESFSPAPKRATVLEPMSRTSRVASLDL